MEVLRQAGKPNSLPLPILLRTDSDENPARCTSETEKYFWVAHLICRMGITGP